MMQTLLDTALQVDNTHYYIEAGLALAATIITWAFSRIISDRDKQIGDMATNLAIAESTTEKTFSFLGDRIDKLREKHNNDMEKARIERDEHNKEIYTEIGRIKDSAATTSKELTQSIHSMREDVIGEIRKLELAIANQHNSK